MSGEETRTEGSPKLCRLSRHMTGQPKVAVRERQPVRLRPPGPPENSILLVCLKGGFFVSFSLCVPWVGLTLCRRMSGIVDPVASQVLGACLILQRILQVVRRDLVNILQPALVPLTVSPVTKVLSAHSEQQL